MKKKTLKHAFASAFSSAVTKQFAAEGAEAIELVALPVLPASPFRTVDSRSGIEFSYDAAALIAVHNAKGRKLPLDIEHNTEKGDDDTRARGWVYALTTAEMEPEAGLEPGVLYAWVELNPLGKQELADKLWGYTSGVALGAWLDEQSIQFTRIKSLALTNNPATEMPMNFTADGEAEDEEDASAEAAYTEQQIHEQAMLSAILESLGLPADATKEQVLGALEALRTPASTEAEQALTACGFTVADLTAGSVVRAEQLTAATEQVTTLTAQVETLTTQLTAAQAEVQTLRSAEAERQVFAAVDSAIAARKATPAQREALVKVAKADLSAFTEAMAAAPEVVAAGSTQTSAAAAGAVATELTAEEKAFCKAYGFKEASYLRAKQQGALN